MKPQPTTNENVNTKVVPAMLSYHWSCPDCRLRQFAEKTQTHAGECKRCGGVYTIAIVRPVIPPM